MTFDELLGLIVDGFEALGVGILVIGSVVGIVGYRATSASSTGRWPTGGCAPTSAARSCSASRS